MDEIELSNIQFFLGLKDELNRRDISIDEVTKILSGKTFLPMDMNQVHAVEVNNMSINNPAKKCDASQKRQDEVKILHDFMTGSRSTATLSNSDISNLVMVFFGSLNHDNNMITAHELHKLFNSRLNLSRPIDLKVTYAIRSKYREILSKQRQFGQIKNFNKNFKKISKIKSSNNIPAIKFSEKKNLNKVKMKKVLTKNISKSIKRFIIDGYRFGYTGKVIVQKIKEKFNKDVTLKYVYDVKYKAHLLERAKKEIPKNNTKVSVFKGKITHEIVK